MCTLAPKDFKYVVLPDKMHGSHALLETPVFLKVNVTMEPCLSTALSEVNGIIIQYF